ncbi:dTDP-4-dehydrorhamnose reductase [Pectobacterium aroidearum]|uniref:dTDP-4-dehydrorhamnose reductase n=1 Tax=Pectobacterium aroidearum TaxID=1201031 RepID=A0AAW3SQ69_9GAMM|nr:MULTISPECIES: dTDP-4-dehydrorhamnose reductase [Pectobacterium]KHS98742.1 dTDP-4-dehydrorhamnose reductase [Pectobacterium brasiliense]MBA5199706.1 dTDP-4-dehydrorhamnose reductase [Pectobacterium aroidearum]MBA5202743.1 dTDP-4-dehydrorhamnose reductase [Pectobacterium aroidearum]MBA5228302.1 dTDP-4-dehydrorhamnose reductase [Pectobacterium aroidearum]MBA5232498.1 dTDP-4-dehydrorhamnose reductase [Pectobacterium aroidearum]
MKILLTGANGQLGRCFQDRLPKDWQVYATDAAELDITNSDQVNAVVAHYQPDAIVNAAAYTAVDKAESEPELAERINAIGPANLATVAAKYKIRLIHVSTDYVFDGNATTPYSENTETNPLSVYGATKLAGEHAVTAALPDAIIVRTAWVFSEYGNNFVKTMLRLSQDRDTLNIVADQHGCPTYAGDLAQALIILLQHKAVGGIYHYSGDKEVSWYQFAQAIFSVAINKSLLKQAPTLIPITTEQYPTPAHRPAYSTLACKKIEQEGITLSNWQNALQKVI